MIRSCWLLISITALIYSMPCARAQTLYFPPTTGSTWETTDPAELGYCPNKIDSLYDFLELNNSKAFILLKDGRIVLEQYFNGHTSNSLWQWASAGKTITAFMTGIAQQEGFLSIENPSSDYLGEGWTSCTPEQEQAITVWHQLTMTSGLDDGVADPTCYNSECLEYLAEPGTRWAYHNGPYTILDQVIENATGSTLNEYVNEKLEAPTGMTGAFFPIEFNNVFFSNARSMARFGLLILNNGTWDTTPVMTDMEYFNDMITPSQDINNSYGYLWWLNGQSSYMVPGVQFQIPGYLNPNAPADVIVAMGKDGQFLNVHAEENLVWIRMGEAPDNLPVPYLLNDDIWKYINELVCGTDGIAEATSKNPNVFPNPATDQVRIEASQLMEEITCRNAQGQVIFVLHPRALQTDLDLSYLPAGFYTLSAVYSDGSSWSGRLAKQ
jgi:CubicO group peptidase (beta-lactamase class C family)